MSRRVYALNLAVLAIFLWSLISGRSPILVGFLLGLALTTHLTSGLMIPMTLIIVPRRLWSKLALGMVIGLLPYLLLFLLADGDSMVVWGQVDSIQGWWWARQRKNLSSKFFLLATGPMEESVVIVGTDNTCTHLIDGASFGFSD